jgi:hypothetical protein
MGKVMGKVLVKILGSSSTALFRGESVIVRDIAHSKAIG